MQITDPKNGLKKPALTLNEIMEKTGGKPLISNAQNSTNQQTKAP